MTSAVVGWPNAHNTRFCTCSLCGTMWNVVRVKCVLCTSTDGISFREIDGRATVKAETCDKCRGYVKILYQVADPSLEPMADDVATLGLDMLLAEEGWKRGGHNPFLLGIRLDREFKRHGGARDRLVQATHACTQADGRREARRSPQRPLPPLWGRDRVGGIAEHRSRGSPHP